jgi:coproporphyrinogen III oxidase-like Fe-S oxidoreductase
MSSVLRFDQWQETIAQALSFNPPHISSYALSIEQSTPFGQIYKNSLAKLYISCLKLSFMN